MIEINGRKIDSFHKPFVIAEIGINHNGVFNKAIRMVDDAAKAGCECVKFQCHIIDDEMIPNDIVPGNSKETIWDIINRCKLNVNQDADLKKYVESKGMIYLSTPFSKAAADRLESMNVVAYKIGSGECNNYPLVEHIAKFGKSVILSTGMNNLGLIEGAVNILRKYNVPHVILHCISMYPTPYKKVNLGAIDILRKAFKDTAIGISDHSIGNFISYAAVALGACVVERHFTSSKSWVGPDISISINPSELKELIKGSNAIYEASGGTKHILPEENPTMKFAYACVVSIKNIKIGECFTVENIWVKRPGTGEIMASNYNDILGKKSNSNIQINEQIKIKDVAW